MAGREQGLVLIALLAFSAAIWMLIGRYSWPKVAGAIRNGLVLGWWLAFGLGLLWSLK